MECPTCKASLPQDSKFCNQCGAPLAYACSACGHRNMAASKFCNQCGVALVQNESVSPVDAQPQPPLAASGFAAERRQLSVMFCDLVGSVALAERLDPEDLRDVFARYHRESTKIVEAAGGLIARYQGDGILVYFGYPLAHEFDAEQAITTGLELVDAVGALGPMDEKLRVRIGIATGVVIVGELVESAQTDQPTIVGETPNLAARLQAIAEPNTIVIDERTHRLAGRLFEYEDLGPLELKGFARALRAWRVIDRSTVESRFEAFHSADLPLVGREEELELLSRRWLRARSGEGQIVLVSGQAGIGKSRLAAELEARLAGELHATMRYSCSPQHQGSALYPVISQLMRTAGIARLDNDDEKWKKLRSLLEPSIKDPLDLALIADLLSIPIGGYFPQIELSAHARKLRTLGILRTIVDDVSTHQPLLILFEDVHWIDPTSLELIELCAEAAEHQKLLVVMTFRSGFAPTWADRPYVTHVPLNRLTRSHASAMINSIVGAELLPEPVLEQILDRTDGVPLFVEELTKTVVERDLARSNDDGAKSAGPQVIPSTLQASLLARLDRLSPVRDVVQIGAAVGREFAFDLISAVYRFSEKQLREALHQLISAELIYRRTDTPNETYKFRHALVQDAAYDTLLRGQRQELHARIAKALEERFPDNVSNEPDVLAYHFGQAGLAQPAIKYWQIAAQRAAERAANVEAAAYFDKALALLPTMPETAERDQQELMLLIGRGLALTAIGSYAASDVGENYRRAHALCRRMGTAPKIFPVLQGLYRFYLVSAELQAALDTTRQLLDIATETGDQNLLMEAHQAQAFSLGFRGELPAAQQHFERCMGLFDPEHFRGRMHLYSTDTATSALCLGALIVWLRGYPDQSARITEQALVRARTVNHPYTLAWALSFAAVLNQLRGEVGKTLELSEECVSLCQLHDFPFWLASGRIMRGWALVDAGEQAAAGIAELRAGLSGWHQTGARVYAPYFTCCLGEACLSAGRPAEGLAPLVEMTSIVEHTGEGWWQSELYRLIGELTSKIGSVVESDVDPKRHFRKALELATRQDARSLALRAAMSLCEASTEVTERKKVRDDLAVIYRGFDEGFSTRDLRRARRILDQNS